MAKKIFITRELKLKSIFRREMKKAGFEVLGRSLLEFELIPFEKLPNVDWIFFYSQTGVNFFFQHIINNNIHLSEKIKFAGFGKKTAMAIEQFTTCHFTGTGKPNTTAKNFLKKTKNENVLFARAKNSKRSVQQILDNQLIMQELILYENFPKEEFDIPKMDYLVFTSPMNAQVYFGKYKLEHGQKVFAIGKTTATTLEELGIENIIFPKKPSEKSLAKIVLDNQ